MGDIMKKIIWHRNTKKTVKVLFIACIVFVIRSLGKKLILDGEESFLIGTSPQFKSRRVSKWMIIQEYPEPKDGLCNFAIIKFPDWHIVLVLKGSDSVFDCQRAEIHLKDFFPGYIHWKTWLPVLGAYIYAIQRGADVIYLLPSHWTDSRWKIPDFKVDVEDSTSLVYNKDFNKDFNKDDNKNYTKDYNKDPQVGNEALLLNFHQHFGCAKKDREKFRNVYNLSQHPIPAIQAPVAIAEQSSDKVGNKCPCDPRSPPVTVAKGVFVDNLLIEEAMFTKEAFWALIFPPLLNWRDVNEESNNYETVDFRLLVQLILWEKGSRIMLHQNSLSDCLRKREKVEGLPSHIYLNSLIAIDEPGVENAADYLIEFIEKLLVKGLISMIEVDLIEQWQQILEDLNILTQSFKWVEKLLSEKVFYESVDFSESNGQCHNVSKFHNQVPITNLVKLKSLYADICLDPTYQMFSENNFDHPYTQYSDILLIIIFNRAHFEVLPLLELLYRPFFPYILYCGHNHVDEVQKEKLRGFQFNFVQYAETKADGMMDRHPGSMNYECLVFAKYMSYSVNGYLVIGDDTLIALPRMSILPKDNIWYPTPIFTIDISKKNGSCIVTGDSCKPGEIKEWFDYYKKNLWSTLKSMAMAKPGSLMHECQQQLTQELGAQMRVVLAHADFYYIPQHLLKKYVVLAKYFAEQKIFVEIAVSTIVSCLQDPKRISRTPCMYEWTPLRDTPWIYVYETIGDEVFIHPTKWGPIFSEEPELTKFYCKTVIPFLHSPRATFPDLRK